MPRMAGIGVDHRESTDLNMSAQDITPARRALITLGLMSATLMHVLDQTIATVALPHMQAALGANRETVAWVLTSYIVATAIVMPVTGWLAGRYGARRLFVVATIGFTIASMACGLATSLTGMIAFRVAQGCFGAFLAPLSQGVMFDIYPREKHAQAVAIWGAGVMVGPILGPVVGGWLTDTFDWRYIFFINLPFGLLAAGLAALVPAGRREERKFDITGFLMLGIGIASLQVMLDRGSQLDWFDSWEIWIELGITMGALWMFGVHSATARSPIFRPALFKDANLVVALVYSCLLGAIVMSGTALISPMLQQLMGYSTLQAGMISVPRGVTLLIAMLAAGRLVSYIDGRLLILIGVFVTAISLWMMSRFSTGMDSTPVMISGAIQGFGFGLLFMPMNLFAFSTIADALRIDAAAIYTLVRSIGGSIGIAVSNALIARNLQISHSDLAQHINDARLPWFDSLPSQLGSMAVQMIDAKINEQAMMIAYIDYFYLTFWTIALIAPLLLLLRKPKHPTSATDALAAME